MKKIGLVANSNAGKNAFLLLSTALAKHGAATNLLVDAGGECSTADVMVAVTNSDVVVAGMAESEVNAKPELEAVECALEHKKPFFLYADTFSVALRPWFKKFIEDAAGVFVVSKSEKKLVQREFPAATVYQTGNPVWWKESAPSKTYKEARRLLGIADDTKLILYGGTKQELADIHVIGELVGTCFTHRKSKVHIVYTIHPGTSIFGRGKQDEGAARMVLERVIRVPKNDVGTVSVSIAPKEVSTEVVQCGADLVAESMSTTGIVAILRRQPLVTFFPPMLRWHYHHLGGSVSEYPLTASRASILAPENRSDLTVVIDSLLFGGQLVERQRMFQEQFMQLETDPCEAMSRILLS